MKGGRPSSIFFQGKKHFYTVDFLSAKIGITKKQARNRIKRVMSGEYVEESLLEPKTRGRCGLRGRIAPEKDLPKDRAEKLVEMTREIESSIDKMDKYYKPLF